MITLLGQNWSGYALNVWDLESLEIARFSERSMRVMKRQEKENISPNTAKEPLTKITFPIHCDPPPGEIVGHLWFQPGVSSKTPIFCPLTKILARCLLLIMPGYMINMTSLGAVWSGKAVLLSMKDYRLQCVSSLKQNSRIRVFFSQREISDQMELQIFLCKMAHTKQTVFWLCKSVQTCKKGTLSGGILNPVYVSD